MTISMALSPVALSLPTASNSNHMTPPSTSLPATAEGFRMTNAQHADRLLNGGGEVAVATHYPAIRTANAFTMPFGRLMNEHLSMATDSSRLATIIGEVRPADAHTHSVAECRGHEGDYETEAATYEVVIRLRSGNSHLPILMLPSPLRSLPFWHPTGGTRRCIVYLEPRRGTPLYMAIERFFRDSAATFGHTEAHQYHPHSSMTGFIDFDDHTLGGQPSGVALVRIATHLQGLVGQMRGMGVPRVEKVSTAYDYPHEGTHKIEVKLETPEAFRWIVDGVVKAVPQAKIRAKRMGHISLAYYNKHVKTNNLMSVEQARTLDAMARDIIHGHGSGVFDPARNLWDIAFYELAFKSDVLSAPHRFNQIARWQL
ncbi:hypothetical protein LPJ66_009453 [Kickxella alabastrina]|uniref:Uncharacterized protein n=1 Tax=Kickxella alabastrina TaxID=61397 RepID=A0ACC1I389_9FUNG|nr:hypothetical protein LPJ66_009453 [Kickxella alabastrina]